MRVTHLCVFLCVCVCVCVCVCDVSGDKSGDMSGDVSGDVSALDTSFTLLNYADMQSRDEVSAAHVWWKGCGWIVWVGG